MATPRAKEFFKTVSSDVALRQKLENAATQDERRSIINASGFSDVSKEDLQEALNEATSAGQLSSAEVDAVGELSDAELEAVAGGATTAWLTAVIMAIVA